MLVTIETIEPMWADNPKDETRRYSLQQKRRGVMRRISHLDSPHARSLSPPPLSPPHTFCVLRSKSKDGLRGRRRERSLRAIRLLIRTGPTDPGYLCMILRQSVRSLASVLSLFTRLRGKSQVELYIHSVPLPNSSLSASIWDFRAFATSQGKFAAEFFTLHMKLTFSATSA
jgi:hypothetical protein